MEEGVIVWLIKWRCCSCDDASQLCLDTLDNWHSGQNAGACEMVGWSGKTEPGCVPDQDMTWE
jgi:hypothetical protein